MILNGLHSAPWKALPARGWGVKGAQQNSFGVSFLPGVWLKWNCWFPRPLTAGWLVDGTKIIFSKNVA